MLWERFFEHFRAAQRDLGAVFDDFRAAQRDCEWVWSGIRLVKRVPQGGLRYPGG